MFERFTDKSRQVLVVAQEAAVRLGHSYIGTEHLLMGVLDDSSGTASQVLVAAGIDPKRVFEEVHRRTPSTPPAPGVSGNPPFTPRAKKTLEMSLREALQLGHAQIGAEHLLLGLLAEGEGVGPESLVAEGADLAQLRLLVAHLNPKAASSTRSAPSTGSLGAVTPAVYEVIERARTRAGARPVGTHHLLAAILEADTSAAVAAIESTGASVEQLAVAAEDATTLHTSDETPEEAVAQHIEVSVDGERVLIAIDNPVLLASIRMHLPKGDAVLADDPRVAHQLGEIWQHVSVRLAKAMEELKSTEPGTDAD